MAEKEKFTCPSCGKEYPGDSNVQIAECRICRRQHCSACIDEYNRCVPCAQKEKPGS